MTGPRGPGGADLTELHDATLLSVELRWDDGEAILRFRVGRPAGGTARLVATGVRTLVCPRQHPWDASVSVNTVAVRRSAADPALRALEMEMQSGDVIALEAEMIRLDVGAEQV